MIVLNTEAQNGIVQDAVDTFPDECCGFIYGHEDSNGRRIITEARAVKNVKEGDKRRRFETAEELLLALERGASRPLTAPQATPLIQRDPVVLWKLLLGVSVLVNVLLIYWLLFLPR
jgi:hypothetical protein